MLDFLCLGSGWTRQFLEPATARAQLSCQFTTRTGSTEGSLLFELGRDDAAQLPAARTVIILFPVKEIDLLRRLVHDYERAHGRTRWLMLGSTGVWKDGMIESTSPVDPENARGQAEAWLLANQQPSIVLNLAGLYGGERKPINFILKAAPTLEALEVKSSLHLIHGDDVAAAILHCHESSDDTLWGMRWIVADGNVYDWWHLAADVPGLPHHYREWASQLASKNKKTGACPQHKRFYETPNM